MRLPKGCPLEWYEDGKWILAREINNDISDELGFDVNKIYEQWIFNLGHEDMIIGESEIKRWAIWASKSRVTLLSLTITALSIIIKMPLCLLVGAPIALLSLYLNYINMYKPSFRMRYIARTRKAKKNGKLC